MRLESGLFFKIVFVGSLCLCFSSCGDDETVGPSATAFHFKLNGKAWSSDSLEISIERNQESANVFANVMSLTSFRGDTSYIKITVNDVRNAQDKDCLSEDKYWGYDHIQVDENYFVEDGGIIYRNGSEFEIVPDQFNYFSSFQGSVQIKDCGENKISGSFAFSIKHPVLDSVIYEITEGKFTNQDFEFVD